MDVQLSLLPAVCDLAIAALRAVPAWHVLDWLVAVVVLGYALQAQSRGREQAAMLLDEWMRQEEDDDGASEADAPAEPYGLPIIVMLPCEPAAGSSTVPAARRITLGDLRRWWRPSIAMAGSDASHSSPTAR